ncbi:helix-turn-helix domain-containing protein [Vallitalea pronyensis]|uniref:Helix-turn-helix domain-containing protein n=1 Tax=Vallitalea pronyensis TaxID=1348613 RepID=A0A8J8SJG2_9FIRM|nr:helix-turn-helix domain-containing protein [Vallitalea pronyensis]QUI25452.1 helix-turn-helix domain-containing protein [Vallitalea pronyensis]
MALRLRENYTLENDTPIRNDLDFLNQSVQRIINDNKKLKEDLHLAIPYVCERYLLSLFDDNEILREDDVTHFLSHYDFTFPNKFFIVIHSTLNFQEGFFETHSKAEYNAICQGSFLIANEAFSTIENRYVFSVAVNQICVILNIPTPSEKSKLAASILKYHKSLDVNDDMMIVHSGVGNLYEGLNGLKKSYNEARQANSQIIYMTTSMVRTYSPQDENITSSHYSIEEDNQMINFLLQGNKEKVLSHYDRIINKNIEEHIGCHGLKELYLQLYNTAVRVINRKHLNIYDIMGEDYINISSQVGDLPVDELYHYIKKVFLKTIDLYAKSNEVHDIANIKQYLDTHYNHEIYLDAIAEHFGKSAKYMSKYIKKVLGISFQDYISSLRIEKSKELLLNTKNSISSIAEEVGFNSRHPFIRKFKILEGVTPTEYRKLHR